MTQVVAALIWQGDRFLICRRPAHKARGPLWERGLDFNHGTGQSSRRSSANAARSLP